MQVRRTFQVRRTLRSDKRLKMAIMGTRQPIAPHTPFFLFAYV